MHSISCATCDLKAKEDVFYIISKIDEGAYDFEMYDVDLSLNGMRIEGVGEIMITDKQGGEWIYIPKFYDDGTEMCVKRCYWFYISYK